MQVGTFDLDFENFKLLKEKIYTSIKKQEDIEINCNFELSPHTAFSINLLKLITLLKQYQQESAKQVVVNILYDKNNLDMIEWVEEYSELIDFPVNYTIFP